MRQCVDPVGVVEAVAWLIAGASQTCYAPVRTRSHDMHADSIRRSKNVYRAGKCAVPQRHAQQQQQHATDTKLTPASQFTKRGTNDQTPPASQHSKNNIYNKSLHCYYMYSSEYITGRFDSCVCFDGGHTTPTGPAIFYLLQSISLPAAKTQPVGGTAPFCRSPPSYNSGGSHHRHH